MTDIVERLRGHADRVQQVEEGWGPADALCAAARAAADEIERLRAATALCEKHRPNGGARWHCVICSGEALSAALSQISYLCGPPNEMGVSPYDVHCDESAVVEQVRAALEKP